MSINILYLLSNKEYYYKYKEFIKDYTISKESSQVLKDMDAYFSQHPSSTEIDWEKFGEWFRIVQHPMYKEEKQNLYQEMFDALRLHSGLDEETESSLVSTMIERDYATQCADMCLKIAEGQQRDALSGLQELLDSYHKDVGKIDQMDSLIVSDGLSDILGRVSGTGLDWRLDCLNRSLGPLRKGDFILVGARPDAGKTTFLASESTYMASQLEEDQVVVWFNNEEQGWKVKLRVIQAGIGWDNLAINNDPVRAEAEYNRLVGEGKIKIIDKADLNVRDVKHFLDKLNPGLIIFDQLWKVHGFEKRAGNDVNNQTLLANQAREWAKEYAPLINVHQLDGSAEGVQYPDMSQFYGSKTSIQGEADGMITIGRSLQAGLENSRFINIAKNKMIGGPKSISAERKGKYEVVLEADIARFKEK